MLVVQAVRYLVERHLATYLTAHILPDSQAKNFSVDAAIEECHRVMSQHFRSPTSTDMQDAQVSPFEQYLKRKLLARNDQDEEYHWKTWLTLDYKTLVFKITGHADITKTHNGFYEGIELETLKCFALLCLHYRLSMHLSEAEKKLAAVSTQNEQQKQLLHLERKISDEKNSSLTMPIRQYQVNQILQNLLIQLQENSASLPTLEQLAQQINSLPQATYEAAFEVAVILRIFNQLWSDNETVIADYVAAEAAIKAANQELDDAHEAYVAVWTKRGHSQLEHLSLSEPSSSERPNHDESQNKVLAEKYTVAKEALAEKKQSFNEKKEAVIECFKTVQASLTETVNTAIAAELAFLKKDTPVIYANDTEQQLLTDVENELKASSDFLKQLCRTNDLTVQGGGRVSIGAADGRSEGEVAALQSILKDATDFITPLGLLNTSLPGEQVNDTDHKQALLTLAKMGLQYTLGNSERNACHTIQPIGSWYGMLANPFSAAKKATSNLIYDSKVAATKRRLVRDLFIRIKAIFFPSQDMGVATDCHEQVLNLIDGTSEKLLDISPTYSPNTQTVLLFTSKLHEAVYNLASNAEKVTHSQHCSLKH